MQAFRPIPLYALNKTKKGLDLKCIRIKKYGFTDLLPQPTMQVFDVEFHLEINMIYPRLLRVIQARKYDT